MTLASTHHEREDLGGGRFRSVIHMKPIAFVRNGALVRDPFALGNSGDPNLTIGCDGISTFRLRDRLSGNAPVIHFGKGQSHIRYTPLATNNVSGLAVGANSFKYPNAWNNADLELVYGGHRIQKNIYLGQGHPSTFQFRIDENNGLDVATLASPDFRILPPVLENPNGLDSIPLEWGKSVQGGKLVLTAQLPVGNWAGWVLDPTLVLPAVSGDGIDTYLDWNNGGAGRLANYGISTQLGLRTTPFNRILLIWFSLIALSGATVQSASLALTVSTPAADNHVVTLNSILAANSGWVEGTKNGAQAGAGEPCWNALAADGSGGITTKWAGDAAGDGGTDAGCSVSGTDYNATALGSFTYIGGSAAGTVYATDLNAAQVQAWVNGTNYGLRGRSATASSLYLASSDHATPAFRPVLTITYTLPLAGHNIGAGIFQGVGAGVM